VSCYHNESWFAHTQREEIALGNWCEGEHWILRCPTIYGWSNYASFD
jgi:hypothetical protein